MSGTDNHSPGSLTLSRRQLLAGVGAGAGALLLEQSGVQAQAPTGGAVVFTHTTVITHDGQRDDVALAVQGGRIAAIGPTDESPEGLSARRGVRRARQGAAARCRQLPFPHGRGHRARVQRGLRVPQHLSPRRAARQPPLTRGAGPDGADGGARVHPHRHDHHRPVRRRHRGPRRGARRFGSPLRVRRGAERRREPGGPGLGGAAREERGAALLREAARRGPAARQRSLQRVARRPGRTHQVLPSPSLAENASPELLRRSAPSPRSTTCTTRST
jgi:hypothetical protein